MEVDVAASTWRATALLVDTAVAASDLSPFWVEVIDILEDAAEARFASDGDGRWPQLDPDTITRRLARGIVSVAVLEASGRLKDSLTGSHPDAVRLISDDRLIFGTKVAYAAYVASRRDPLPETDRPLRAEIADTLIAHLTGAQL